MESDLSRESDLRKGAERLAEEAQSSLSKEEERAEDLKTRLTTTRDSLSAAEASLQEARADHSVVLRKLEQTTAENEKLKCEVRRQGRLPCVGLSESSPLVHLILLVYLIQVPFHDELYYTFLTLLLCKAPQVRNLVPFQKEHYNPAF